MTPILGFAPDAEQTTPGLLGDCSNFVPYLNGMQGAPTAVSPVDTPPLADVCTGAAVVAKLDNTRRIVAGTQTKLYELLAANRADPIQRSTGAAFASISSAPRAEIVFSVGSFVMALNTNDGAEKPDGWHCCAAFDDTSWTPSVTTQATSGRLVSTTGPITAGGRLGEYAVAYKARSMYLGQYVGAPAVWDWIQIRGGNAGCVGKEAFTDVNGVHFFVGEDNFWMFDGTTPVPLGDGAVRFWFKENSNPGALYKTICTFDRQNNLVYIFYPSRFSDVLDSTLVYHVQTKKWGRADRFVEASLEFVSPGATIDGLTAYSATIDGLPPAGFDSQYWLAGGRSLSVFNTAHQLQSLTGPTATSSLLTAESGDDDTVIMLKQIRLRYAKSPTSATVLTMHKMNSGQDYKAGPSGTMNDGKFDTLKSARWHRARISFVGPVQVTGMDAQYQPDGGR